MRIFGTASASSVREDRPASYRLFDVSRSNDGFDAEMTLKTLRQDAFHVEDEISWRC